MEANPLPPTHARLRYQLACAALAALGSILIVVLRLGLWNFDLRVPIAYSGDALYETVLVKAMTESGWAYHIAHLGAPFGMDAVDFPIGCTLDFAIIKLLSFAISNPFLLINLFWLFAIGLAAASATLFLQSFRLRLATSSTFGILYGIIPFVFYRNISHLNLIHYIVPAGAYLGFALARGEGLPPLGKYFRHAKAPLTWAAFFFRLGLCAAVGLTYIYWAFFTSIALAFGCLVGACRTWSISILLAASIYLSVIGVFSVADISASLAYWSRQGANTTLEYKSPREADTYGLRIRQMFTPIDAHPLALFRIARFKIVAAGFPNDANESSSSALGTIGAIGFLFVIGAVLLPASGKLLANRRIRLLGCFTIAFVLIAEVGGFGSLFNVFVVHEFRAYNRISPFISLFSLAGLALLFDHALRRRGAAIRSLGTAGILAIGAFDQIPVFNFHLHKKTEATFYRDRSFIRQLETRLPAGTLIFQLPHTGFPLDTSQTGMGPYDNARAYLHSKTLNWSWGALDGRQSDWAKTSAALPAPDFLQRIIAAGFTGLLLDRAGYSDETVETTFRDLVGPTAVIDSGGRWLYFDLRKLSDEYLAGKSPEMIAALREIARHPVQAEWLPTFSGEERGPEGTWRWCGRKGSIRFVNDSDVEREVEWSATVQQFSPQGARLVLQRDTVNRELTLSANAIPIQDSFKLPPHGVVEEHFDFLGDLLHVPTDSRELAFELQNFRMTEHGPAAASQKLPRPRQASTESLYHCASASHSTLP